MKRVTPLTGLFVCICVGSVAAVFPTVMTLAQAAIEKTPAKVLTEKLEKTALFDNLTYPARVSAKINTTVLAETDGVVSQIIAPLGTSVKQGDKILIIEHTDPVYRYAPFTVVAPVSGVVSTVEITQGSQITRGQKLVSVTNPKRVEIKLEIPAADLGYLRARMSGEFRLSLSGDQKTIALQIAGISPFVDPTTGTASANLDVSQAKLASEDRLVLVPGSLGFVSFKVHQRLGYSVPETAVYYKGSDTFLRLFENGHSKQVPVKLGQKSRGMVEILGKLPEHAVLIERSSRFIADGEAVEIQEGT